MRLRVAGRRRSFRLPQKGESPRIEILKSDDRIDIEILKRRPGAYAIDSPAALDRFLGAEKQ